MSYLYRVTLDVDVRAENMGDAEKVLYGRLQQLLEVQQIECTDTVEIDDTPSDREMESFYGQCEPRDAWSGR